MRLEIKSWFQRNAPSLGELYEGAVLLIYEIPVPGKVRFVCHAVREIRNRLPDVISGMKTGGRLDYKSRLDKIAELWDKNGYNPVSFSKNVLTEKSESLPQADISIQANDKLFQLIGRLIQDHNAAREKPTDAAQRLFECFDSSNRQSPDTLVPRINQWLDITNWFMGKAHDSGKVDSDCNFNKLQEKFELFEATLGSLIREFFKTVDELDEILEDANT